MHQTLDGSKLTLVPYGLGSTVYVPDQRPAQDGSSAAAAHLAAAQDSTTALADAGSKVQQLQQQTEAAQQAAAAVDATLDQARQAIQDSQQDFAAAQLAVQQARHQQHSQATKAEQLMPELQQQLQAAKEAAQLAAADLHAVGALLDKAQQQHQHVKDQLATTAGYKSRRMRAGSGGKLSMPQSTLDDNDYEKQAAQLLENQHLASQASAAVDAAWSEADKATQQQKKVARQVSALQKELHKMQQRDSSACPTVEKQQVRTSQ